MTVNPVSKDRDPLLTPPLWPDTSSPTWAEAPHAGPLGGATATGEATRLGLTVRIGLWLDASGGVRQARWRAVEDPALRLCAEAACALLEAGVGPAAIDPAVLRRAAPAPHAIDTQSAELVTSAVQAAGWISISSRP